MDSVGGRKCAGPACLWCASKSQLPSARDHAAAHGPPCWLRAPRWLIGAASLRCCVSWRPREECSRIDGARSALLSRRRTVPAGEFWTGTGPARLPLAAGTRTSRGGRHQPVRFFAALGEKRAQVRCWRRDGLARRAPQVGTSNWSLSSSRIRYFLPVALLFSARHAAQAPAGVSLLGAALALFLVAAQGPPPMRSTRCAPNRPLRGHSRA